MDLNTAIKQIVRGMMDNESLSNLVYGTWGGSTVKIDGKPLSVPIDMIDVPKGMTVEVGDRVALHQQHGGQRYFVEGVLQ